MDLLICVFIGTTSTCAIDDLEGVEAVLGSHPQIWRHVDAAYAGSALLLPEFQYLSSLMRSFDSFNVNINKWLFVNTDARLVGIEYW